MCQALGSSRTREKDPCDRVLSLPCGFHMVAELPGAVTAKAMSRPEQEETVGKSLRKQMEDSRKPVS